MTHCWSSLFCLPEDRRIWHKHLEKEKVEKRSTTKREKRSTTSQRQHKSWSKGWKVTVWSSESPSVENRSGMGSWTVHVEAGEKEMSVGQPAEGSRQLPTGHSCKLHCSYQGDAANYKWVRYTEGSMWVLRKTCWSLSESTHLLL